MTIPTPIADAALAAEQARHAESDTLQSALADAEALAAQVQPLTDQVAALQAQVATLTAQLAQEIDQETADQQQIAALQAQLVAIQAQLAALQALYDADEAILHPPPPPPPPPPVLTGPMMGMDVGGWWFVGAGWPNDGSYAVAKVADFERLIGRGVTLINQSLQNQTPDWASYQSSAINTVINNPGAVVGLPPRRSALRFQLGITGQSAAANFAEIAGGGQDARFTAIFQAIKDRGFDRPFLGLGQESDGDWWANTCSLGNEPAFKAAFRRVAALAKAVIPDCVICYDVASTRDQRPGYPGDDVVDAIILDYYDWGSGVGDAHGLAETLSFNKPFMLAEWAAKDSLQGAAFIDFVWQTCTGSPLFLGQCYWNRHDPGSGDYTFAANPLSGARYIEKFGGQNPPIYQPPPPPPVGQSTVKLTKWSGDGGGTISLELFVAGTSYGVKQVALNAASWDVPIAIAPGTAMSAKMTGTWCVLGSCVVTDASGARTFTFTGGRTVSNGQTAGWAAP